MVNFHEEAITEGCRQALRYLDSANFIDSFYLAGGTALALQIGHRVSTDLDWFATNRLLLSEEREQIVGELAANQALEVTREQDGMLFTRVFGTDVSFIHQQHPLLEPTIPYGRFQLASPTDIGLMKLAAVNSRGTRRDFVDLYCLREIVSLDQLLQLAADKYSNRPNFLAIAARALAYFEDAEPQHMPELFVTVLWKDVRAYCEAAAARLGRRLGGLEDR